WAIDLSHNGKQVALSDSREVVIWDVVSDKVRHRLAHKARQVAFSPDGKSLIAAGAWVQRWNLETGKPVYPESLLNKPVGPIILKWSADGKRLLAVWPGERISDSRPFRSDLLAVWDTAEMKAISRWRTEEAVLACTFDGSTARCYLDRKLIRTWVVEHP